jgi:hypothetical protein
MKQLMLPMFVIMYVLTLIVGCRLLFSDGEKIERMIVADAPYAHTKSERDKIVNVAAATRLGFEYSPELIYGVAIKSSIIGLIFVFLMYISTTVALLYYSDMKGTLAEYGAAFVVPLWILSIANLFNPLLKLYLSRVFVSLSPSLVLRPFDWANIWHILSLKTDVFFITYVFAAGIGCAAIAGISKGEGIGLVAIVWLVIYFTAMLLGIEPIISM